MKNPPLVQFQGKGVKTCSLFPAFSHLIFFFLFSFLLLALTPLAPIIKQAQADPNEKVIQLLQWEHFANKGSDPSQRVAEAFDDDKKKVVPMDIVHYNIPLELVQPHFVADLNPEIRKSLIFTKEMPNGEKKTFVRWIVNPEDTQHYKKLEDYLKQKGVDPELAKETSFKGYLTASRSLILEAPDGTVFSAKVSTNKTGGKWHDKKLDANQVHDSMLASQLVHDVAQAKREYEEKSGKPFPFQAKTLKLLMEPVGFSIGGEPNADNQSFSAGLVTRELADMAGNQRYYLPGFSALHSDMGKEIARKNGSDNPLDFWQEHYVRPLAKAQAEFVALYGMSIISAHSQNFLIELDDNYRPTGKIVLRDFNDGGLLQGYKHLPYAEKHPQAYDYKLKTETLEVRFGLFHGSGAPDWMEQNLGDTIENWTRSFFSEFEGRLQELTGIDSKSLARGKKEYNFNSQGYSSITYKTDDPSWRNYFQITPCLYGKDQTADGVACEKALDEWAVLGKNSCRDLLLQKEADEIEIDLESSVNFINQIKRINELSNEDLRYQRKIKIAPVHFMPKGLEDENGVCELQDKEAVANARVQVISSQSTVAKLAEDFENVKFTQDLEPMSQSVLNALERKFKESVAQFEGQMKELDQKDQTQHQLSSEIQKMKDWKKDQIVYNIVSYKMKKRDLRKSSAQNAQSMLKNLQRIEGLYNQLEDYAILYEFLQMAPLVQRREALRSLNCKVK